MMLHNLNFPNRKYDKHPLSLWCPSGTQHTNGTLYTHNNCSHGYWQVFSGAILQQVFIVEYIVHGQMCDECHRREAKDYWNSVVQVRQKVSHISRSVGYHDNDT